MKNIIEKYPEISPGEMDVYKVKDNGKQGYGERFDAHWENRRALINTLFACYTEKQKPLIRFLLAQEIECCREYDAPLSPLKLLAYMLYSLGDIEDTPLLYEAKFETNFDAGIELDIELIFGEDKDKTKEYFAKRNQKILKVIKTYETRPYLKKADYLKRIQERGMLDYWLEDD